MDNELISTVKNFVLASSVGVVYGIINDTLQEKYLFQHRISPENSVSSLVIDKLGCLFATGIALYASSKTLQFINLNLISFDSYFQIFSYFFIVGFNDPLIRIYNLLKSKIEF